MKTTFLPALALLLASLWLPQSIQASTPPVLGEDADALETSPAATLATAELQPGPAKVAGNNVNVRAKATIKSEVVTQMQDGEEVFVEEVILRPDAQGKDPARWAQIAYPAQASAWVHSLYIDPANNTVKPKKLNVRSGPGENHTIIGTLQAGDAITPLDTKGDWISIQPPKGTTAYIAAKLLRQETMTVTEIAAAETTETVTTNGEPMETEVVEAQEEIATSTETTDVTMVAVAETTDTEAVEGATTVTDTNDLAATMGLEPLPEVAPEMEPISDEPLPPRIVQREGIVRSFTSIQAPSDYKLVSPDNGRTINYLYTTSTNLDLSRYLGLHIVATGEESLDRRWPSMPVLTLKRIILVE